MLYVITPFRPQPDARRRMVVSTALLVRERGARATSIDDVLAHSGAPRGSVYHHFPGGRDELLREATAYAGEFVARRLEAARGQDALSVLDGFIAFYRDELPRSDWRVGCPVVAVAIEARDDGDHALQDEAGHVFTRWTDLLAARLAEGGLAPDRAREQALLTIASVEGALVLCRAQRRLDPLDSVHQQLRALLASSLDDPVTSTPPETE
jgi:AcrR family transcriptional regulator